jgi:hypothetical protein
MCPWPMEYFHLVGWGRLMKITMAARPLWQAGLGRGMTRRKGNDWAYEERSRDGRERWFCSKKRRGIKLPGFSIAGYPI